MGRLDAGLKVGKGVAGLGGFTLGVEHVKPGFTAYLVLAMLSK